MRQVRPHERLAAGESQPPHAHLRDDAHKPHDLFEREDFVARLEADVLVRHAVEAADVAAIGDADPQAVVHAAESVDERRYCLVMFVMLAVNQFGCTHSVVPSAHCFALPNRHVFFQRVDQPLAGGEGVGAVGRADDDRHAGFGERHAAEAMNDEAFYDRPAAAGFGFELCQFSLGHRA